ncbi:sulfotransferase family protein [Sphingomonas dokdonensis]|uniref:Sulfotransferase domain protein n=1 Tax=Sphingomonas dokdonensis TaxID=344880 RepID=A0A245ZTV0_9SPHN|nr:sulfotransferase [Sphingomonas dokdonensis]OWK33169.1 hypothetical protein SPDO_00430 [Sphingomonas dokdonensis]
MLDAALEGAWRRGWAERPTLDPEGLLRKAAGRTAPPPDDPDNGWRTRLDALCHDLETVAHLTPLGRTIAHGQLVAALRNRRRLHALWRRHPEIADQPIHAPIIIVGQMRSGTTRIQRLLACDPRLAFTRFFESWNPLPQRPGRAWLDDRKIRGRLATMSVRLLNPAFGAIHPTHWNDADEEIGLQSVSIFGSAFEAQWRVPAYTAHVEADDGIMAYAEFRRLLQTLAWLRRDDGSRPWILKVPQFSQDLPAVLHTFPDARLVCLSRDPQAVISSSASLVRNQMTIQSARVDPRWIAREWTRKVALRTRRTTEVVARSEASRVEVRYHEVDQDWRREIQRIYKMIGISLPATALARMNNYMAAARSDRHVKHRYPTVAMEHRSSCPSEPSVPVPAIPAAA